MTRLFVLILLSSLIILESQAQVFKKYYERPGNQYSHDIINCIDGGYLILSTGLVSKVDQNGEVIWEKQLNFFGGKVAETNGGFYIAGSIDSSYFQFGYLVKINKQGDFLWTKEYKKQDIGSLKHIKRLLTGDLILSFSHYWLESGFPNYTILRTDSLGNIIWSRSASQNETSNITILDNNEIVITGSKFQENQPPQFPETCWPFKEKYNISGSTLSHVHLPYMDWTECTASISDGESYYIATSNDNYSVFKMGDSLVHWTNYFGDFEYNSMCTDTNNLYLTGSLGNTNWAELFVLSISCQGDSISTYINGDDYNQHGKKIIIDKDSLVILGHAKKFNTSDFDVFLTKIPIQYILTYNNEVSQVNTTYLEINPNPTSSILYFENFTDKKTKNVKVYNISGELEINTINADNFIDVTELSQGLYLIEILSDKGKKIAKFIKK
jgi:type IX secretion system substrate protein